MREAGDTSCELALIPYGLGSPLNLSSLRMGVGRVYAPGPTVAPSVVSRGFDPRPPAFQTSVPPLTLQDLWGVSCCYLSRSREESDPLFWLFKPACCHSHY